jgi:hypothetical protein
MMMDIFVPEERKLTEGIWNLESGLSVVEETSWFFVF